ncbi:MAG: hypothetical protein ACK55I_47000, partial [bacterium]
RQEPIARGAILTHRGSSPEDIDGKCLSTLQTQWHRMCRGCTRDPVLGTDHTIRVRIDLPCF